MVHFELWRLVVSVCFQGEGGGVSGCLIARHATLHTVIGEINATVLLML